MVNKDSLFDNMQPLSEGMSPLEILTFMHFYDFFIIITICWAL